jgi:hypothetical protein
MFLGPLAAHRYTAHTAYKKAPKTTGASIRKQKNYGHVLCLVLVSSTAIDPLEH